MSLLLDALKKNGSAQQQGDVHATAGSGLSLAEPHARTQIQSPAPSTSSPGASRAAGDNLFAAKKMSAGNKFTYSLGIVPTALIIGSVLAVAGGLYVWNEIQPPRPVPRRASPPAPPELASTPVTTPLVQQYVAPPLIEEEKPRVMARATRPRVRAPGIAREPAAPRPASNIRIAHQAEVPTVDPTLAEAYQAYQNGDFGTAWQRYREVLQKDPTNRDALLGVAAIAQRQGQDDVAAQYYRQVLALDPRDPVANAGMASFSTGDAAGKESRLKQLLAQSPQSSSLHFALGNLYSQQSRWGDAQQAYFNAFRLRPANALFAFSLATSLDHLGQSKLAAQYYQQALQLDTSGNSGFDRTETQQRLDKLNAH